MRCHILPFVPGRRPTDETAHPGLGSSDSFALVTGDRQSNRAIVLFEVSDLPTGASADASLSVDGEIVPDWDRQLIDLTPEPLQQLEIWPNKDLAGVDLGLRAGLLRRLRVEIRILVDGSVVASDDASLDACDVRNLGSLYERIVQRLVAEDTIRQAHEAGVSSPGLAYHPWYPVLTIGGDKFALYTVALVADIVGKTHHLTDPAWLMRVGVYLELLTCLGIFEAVRDDVGDLLAPDERVAFEESDVFTEIRRRINPDAWREVWAMRRISFPGFGTPRTGPVSVLNLLKKRDATLAFLEVHHDDLKQAIELAGPNSFNAQETWQRVFRDAERAVLRQAADAFPELAFLPARAREVLLWQRFGFSGQRGLYPTACEQYRSSMNSVADWAEARGLMSHAGEDCIPAETSLLEAYMGDRQRIAVLQRQDGLSPELTVIEPIPREHPTVEEIERLLADVPILQMIPPDDIHELAMEARPLLLGPTQRFVVEGQEGTSLFLVGEGKVEVRLRNDNGSDWLVETMGPGEIVGEMALLTGEKRAATVRSVGESIVYEISRHQYEPLLLAHPEWLDELADIMAERLARRRDRAAELDASHRSPSLVDRIRRNFFG